MSQSKPSALAILGRALRVGVLDLPVILPAALVAGGLGHLLIWWSTFPFRDESTTDQTAQLLQWYLPEAVTGLLVGIFLWPFVDAMAMHCYLERQEGRTPGLGGALAFARRRYRVMFGPHAAAYITITLGLTVAIPGIVFALWYAFVDAITATQDGVRRPLRMSKRLTAGVRSTIFKAWIPYGIWFTVVFGNPWVVLWLESRGTWWVLGSGLVDGILLCIMEIAMLALFQDRMERLRERRRALEAQKAAGEPQPAR